MRAKCKAATVPLICLSCSQVDLAHRGDASLAAKLPYLARRLGEAHKAAGQLEEAEVALRDVLRHQLPLEEKLQVLALLADVQLKEDSAELEVKVQQRLQEQLQAAGGDTSKVRLKQRASMISGSCPKPSLCLLLANLHPDACNRAQAPLLLSDCKGVLDL